MIKQLDENLPRNLFQQNGYIHVKDIISKDLCYFLTHVLLRKSSQPNPTAGSMDNQYDTQVPGCLAVMDHEIMFETVQEKLWHEIEFLTGKELLPTYSFARLYKNDNVLEKHSDRPECEISVTIQLGRSHHYAWPIYMNNSRIDMGEGDAVVYKGCDIEHWRNRCDGPPGYYSGQVFLHFVDARGPYANKAFDIVNRKPYQHMFLKNRSIVMETK